MTAQPSHDAIRYLQCRWDLANEEGAMLPIPDVIRRQFAERAYPIFLGSKADDPYLAAIVDDIIARWQLAEGRRALEDAADLMRAQARGRLAWLALAPLVVLLAALFGHCFDGIAERISPAEAQYVLDDEDPVPLGAEAARSCPDPGRVVELDSGTWCYFGKRTRVRMR